MTPAATDPTLAADYLFTVPYEPDAVTGLALQLHAAVKECRAAAGLDPDVPFRLDPDTADSSPLLHAVERRPRPGGGFLDLGVRQVQDAVWVQITDHREGTFPAAALPPLAPFQPEALRKQQLDDYLGLFLRASVEFPPGTPPADVRALARAVGDHYFPADPWHEFDTANGVLLLRFRDTVGHAVLAYPAGDGAAVTDDLLFVLPFLAMCHFKAVRAQKQQRAHSATAHRLGRDLERELDDEPARADRRLAALQRRLDTVSRLVEQLAEHVVRIEAGLHTLAANRAIVDRLLAGPTVFRTCKGLDRVVVDTLADLLKVRATTELGFRRATLERGRVHIGNLDATIDLQQANQNRRLSLVMAALTCLQAVALFPILLPEAGPLAFKEWATAARVATAAGITAGGLAAAWFWMNRSR